MLKSFESFELKLFMKFDMFQGDRNENFSISKIKFQESCKLIGIVFSMPIYRHVYKGNLFFF